MYGKLFIGAMLVAGVPMLCLADGPDSGAIPPDYGPFTAPPKPPAGKPVSGWIFLSHPHHFWTPLYYLRDGVRDRPAVSILVSPKRGVRNVHQAAIQAFDTSPRLNLSIRESPLNHSVSVASGDIVPIAGRLVKFERAKFPADYPQASIPKNVMDRGLRWTDITDSVPAEFRPGKGWPLVLATSDPEKQSGQHRNYKLFPDPNLRRPEGNKRPLYVRVADITAKAGKGEKAQAEIEIIDSTRLRQQTVRKMTVRLGQSIQHELTQFDETGKGVVLARAHRVLKIVPPQKIAGLGKLIGWVEIELK